MGIPLLCSERLLGTKADVELPEYPHVLTSFKGVAPYEYADSGDQDGVNVEPFTISETKRLA
jgi:hypothetical protein